MKSAKRALLLLVVLFMVGAWGCSQHPGSASGAGSARIRDLESRNAKLDEDYRNAVASRDQARKQAVALEEAQSRQQGELQQVTRECEELRKQVNMRLGERDALQANLVQFAKELQNLAGKVDAAVNFAPPATAPATTTAPVATLQVKS